jgi:hypothetical protein
MWTKGNGVSDMVSPLYWFFFYDSGKQIVYDVRHVPQGFPLIQMLAHSFFRRDCAIFPES